MKNPMRNDSAAWCELRCLKNGFGIEIAVHQSFFESWNSFELPKGSLGKPVWPEGSETEDDWRVWKINFPRDVMGKGREEAWLARLFLRDLFGRINTALAFDCKSSAKSCQLLFIEYFLVSAQPKGGGFTVVVCPSLDECVSVKSKESHGRYSEKITKKMRSAGNHMAMGQKWNWSAMIDPDQRIQFAGGFGTVLCTSLSDRIEGSLGQRLTSDNIDGSYEQLVLLYAVAVLHDLARKDGAV